MTEPFVVHWLPLEGQLVPFDWQTVTPLEYI